MSSSKLSWANITAKMDEEAATEFRYSVLDYLANMVLFSGNPAGVEALSDLATQDILDGKLDNISSLMRMVAPDCRRMVLICRWHGEFRDCSEMFTSSKT